MMIPFLYSAPEEPYSVHIMRCLSNFEIIFPIFELTLKRIFNLKKSELKENLRQMILFHDLGKLTKRWQEAVKNKKSTPPHAAIGAAYIWKSLPDNEGLKDLKYSMVFAIAIHHTDSGLLGDNIERPDVQAILEGVADYEGKIIWHENAEELFQENSSEYFPKEARDLSIFDLKEMARGLRVWAKGGSILKQHKRRMQACLSHHIFKLCDISAAIERREFQKDNGQDYYGGWLMVKEIGKYVENISQRVKL